MYQKNNGYPQRQNYPPAKTTSPSSRLFLVAFVFILVLLGGGGYMYMESTNKKIETVQQEISTKDQQLNQISSEHEVLKAQYDELGSKTCKGTWSVASGCILPETIITSPQGGEVFCLGSTTTVRWDTNFLSEGAVDIHLVNQGDTLRVGSIDASVGEYVWDIKKATLISTSTPQTVDITPGDLYTLSLQSEAEFPNGGSGAFSISACEQ